MTCQQPLSCTQSFPRPPCDSRRDVLVMQGGNIGFFQALCLLGYCLFPIDIAAVVSVLIHVKIVRWTQP